MKKLSLILLLTLLGCTASAQYELSPAQQPISEPDSLWRMSSLEVVAAVLKHNFDIEIAQDNIRLAALNNNWGETGRYPSIDMSIGSQNSYTNENNPASVFGTAEILSADIQGSLEANWRIFGGLQTYINKQRLELLEKQSRGNADLVIQNAVQAALVEYQNALIAKVQYNVLQEAATFSKERLGFTKTKEDIGTVSSFVTLQDELAYQADQTNTLQQQLNYRDALRKLNQLMGREPTAPLELTDTLTVDTTRFDYDDLKALLAENPDLELEFINLELQKRQLQLERRDRLPTLDLSTGGSRSYNYGDLSSEQFNRTGYGDSYRFFANFTLSFNIYNGGQASRDIEEAVINTKIARTNIRQVRHQLTHELATALDRYLVQLEILKLSQGRLKNARKNLRLAKERYEGGLINTFDFREIQLEQLRAEQVRLESIQALKVTQLNLLRLTGRILPEDR
ncbi:MAG: TolC family protein [Bacteroidota bacterium]